MMTKLEIINAQIECLQRQLKSYTNRHSSGHWSWLQNSPDLYGEQYIELYNPEKSTVEKLTVREVYWLLYYQVIPEGSVIKPRCDAKNCVNPEHLDIHYYLGENKHYPRPNDDSDWGIPNGWNF